MMTSEISPATEGATATGGAMSEEEAKLQFEADRAKIRLIEARKEFADVTLYQVAESVDALPKKVQLQTRRSLKGHFDRVYALDWAGDSRHLLTASQDGLLILWDGYTGHKVNSISSTSKGGTLTCALSPQSNLAATGGLNNLCSIYNFGDRGGADIGLGKPSRELIGHNSYLTCCRFLDQNRLITCSGDCLLIVWDVETGEAIGHMKGHTSDVSSFSISRDNEILVSGACDKTAKLWDIRTFACTHTFFGHEQDINDISFGPSARCFGTSCEDGSCGLFDIRAEQMLACYSPQNSRSDTVNPCYSLSLSSSGRLLFSGYGDGTLQVWDTLKGIRVGLMTAHKTRISTVRIPLSGDAICSGSFDNAVKIWN